LKSIISSNWLRCSGTLLAGAALTLITLNVWAAPTLFTPDHESIAKKIMALQASKERWIQVDLKSQRLIAWEGANPVYAIVISTGKASTPTRPGIFKIQQNLPGFPHLEASERSAHKAQVGEEWRDGASMEPSKLLVDTSRQ
jgi:hypothetical protein